MMDMQNFAVSSDPTPEWMRAERYDYCDHFYDKDNSRVTGIRELLNKFFKF